MKRTMTRRQLSSIVGRSAVADGYVATYTDDDGQEHVLYKLGRTQFLCTTCKSPNCAATKVQRTLNAPKPRKARKAAAKAAPKRKVAAKANAPKPKATPAMEWGFEWDDNDMLVVTQ